MSTSLRPIVKKAGINLALVFASFLVSLILAELFLRYFYPRYQHAAGAQYSADSIRIWSRTPYSLEYFQHPDTGVAYPVYHNNLALRQHRDFTEDALSSVVNLAFFGDSFVENRRVPAQYSFTEPLDYLLNKSGQRFNVLNFGVDGYGTDQAYLYYRTFEQAPQLDYVFYVYTPNDLRNIYENNLFTLDASGNLLRTTRNPSSQLVRFLSRFHITYLILDVRERLLAEDRDFDETNLYEWYVGRQQFSRFHSPRADEISDSLEEQRANEDLARTVAIFQALLHEWQQSVEENGGEFYIVVLPRDEYSRAAYVIGDGFKVINLYEIFSGFYPDYQYDHIRFANDSHWNEVGNLLAAVHLYYWFMEQNSDLPALSNEGLMKELYTYYSAFTGGWMPPLWVKETPTSPEAQASIRATYIPLELQEATP